MVKVSLTGKKQTTTQALGGTIARWIMQAGCGVMVLWRGELLAATMIPSPHGSTIHVEMDNGETVNYEQCRIYRDTVRQIKSMIGLA